MGLGIELVNHHTKAIVKIQEPILVCVLCKEIPFTSDCPTCQNILTYRSNSAERNLLKEKQNEEIEELLSTKEVEFPGPGIIKRSSIYGNYIVASKKIESGEIICIEKPLLIAPYAPSDILPLCLSCYKDVGISSKCSKCRWPICNSECEMNSIHAENECKIFQKNAIRTKDVVTEYFSIETLRGLLIREKAPKIWKKLLRFESHKENRMNNTKAVETLEFITNFIQNKCQLKELYDKEIINHLVGVLSVNTFWGFKDLNSYSSLLFDCVTLFAHDCNPNTNRQLIYLDDTEAATSVSNLDSNGNIIITMIDHDEEHLGYGSISGVGIRIEASRTIEIGEMITIQYIDVNVPVQERRKELKELFYFDCSCERCLIQLLEESLKIESGDNNTISYEGDITEDDKLNDTLLESI